MRNVPELIRLIIADDHDMLRCGLQHTFSFEKDLSLVSSVADGRDLVAAAREHKPDVIITDLKMSNMDGPEACAIICKDCPETSIIVYSMYDSEDLVRQMRGIGVRGYLLKNGNGKEVCDAVRTVQAGGEYYCASIRQRTNQLFRHEKLGSGTSEKKQDFTGIELQVIKLFCQGCSAKAIASTLKIKVRMVQTHKERIEEKMDVKGEVQIVVYAMQNWLLY